VKILPFPTKMVVHLLPAVMVW